MKNCRVEANDFSFLPGITRSNKLRLLLYRMSAKLLANNQVMINEVNIASGFICEPCFSIVNMTYARRMFDRVTNRGDRN
jgi:hypothetical protein